MTATAQKTQLFLLLALGTLFTAVFSPSFLFAADTPVKAYFCQTSPTDTSVGTQIEASAWNPNKCYNNGPNGELSNLAQQVIQQLDNAIGQPTNDQCVPVIPQCPCGMTPGLFGLCTRPGPNKNQCPCTGSNPADPTQIINGICVAEGACAATNFTDPTGQKIDISKIGGIVGDIFKGISSFSGLLQGSSFNGGVGTGGYDTGGCTEYYTTSVITSDPCAQYVPSGDYGVGTGSSVADQLLDALNGGVQSSNVPFGSSTTSGSTGNQLLDLILQNSNTNQTNSTNSAQVIVNPLGGNAATMQNLLLSNTVTLASQGTHGDIQVTSSGGTIIAGSRDVTGGTEIVGFYGGDASGFNSQPQGVIANLCRNRPWAGSFIAYVIPPSFFDGLCSWRGYQVGIPTAQSPTQSTGGQSTSFTAPVYIPATTTVSTVEPKVDIWAIPSKVTLGARTSVFWNSQGVKSCTVKSSDGSFSESSTSGGAATVPITSATTFVVTCITDSGTTISDSIVVGLGI